MGNQVICHHCFRRRSISPQESKKIRILLVGLDNAGKTTAAKGLVGDPVSSPAPTLGFSRLEVRRRGWTVELYDVGGGRGIRGIWRNYLAESHGLAFVVDAADLARADECRDTLHALLADPRVAGKPVLILANKQDEPSALDEVELNERLRLESAANQHRCPMRIELCAARPGAAPANGKKLQLGVQSGFDWLTDYVIDNNAALEVRVTADLAVRAAELEQQRRARDERIRRNREAAAAAAAAEAAAAEAGGGGDGDGPRESTSGTNDPVETMAVSPSAEDATVSHPGDTAAPGPADVGAGSPDPAPPSTTPHEAEQSPAPPPPLSAGLSSPDTPLQPELEAQIQEVFTRTEMGRLVRDQTGRRGTHDSAAGETRDASDSGSGSGSGGGGREAGGKTDGDAAKNGEGDVARDVARNEDGGEAADPESVVVNPPPPGDRPASREQTPDSVVLEHDSGQGSTKESDSELQLGSSGASQMSTQANGSVPGKRRNRFFKRYAKTAPMPNDVLLASMSSVMPPAAND